MRQRNKQVEKGLRTIDPLAADDLDALVADSDPDRLLSTILATPEQKPSGRRSAPRRRLAPAWRRPVLVAAPVLAAALAALAIGIPGGGNGGEALSALTRVAKAAAAQPAPDTDFPFQYVRTRQMGIASATVGPHTWGWIQSETGEAWIAKDGSGFARRKVDAPKWLGPRDREAWIASGRIDFLERAWAPYTEEEDVAAGHFNDRSVYATPGLSKLPTDPAELAAWLEHQVTGPEYTGNGFPASVRTLTVVAELLSNPLASPELRAALYEAEALIPGIESFGTVRDAIGREGVAVGAESANSGAPSRYLLIFDPESSRVLGTEQIWLRPPPAFKGEEPNQVADATLFVESHGANSLGG